ncbi:SOUL family heme-binding protein [Melittangium boletus]|uniref:SOUL family heme-binding protein n=1 Tax=Melittangium boletus TaxID=83453 RepID=UPI003DA67B39
MNRQRQVVAWASGAVVVGALGWAGWKVFHKKTGEPRYRVVGEQGGVELRQYGPTLVAVTEVEGAFDKAVNEGFHRLAGYIFGGNQRELSLPMTAPVGLRRAEAAPPGEKLPMTAPVGLQRDGARWRMTFVMPEGYTLDTLPEPLDSRVRLEAVPGKRVAAWRFSGGVPESVAKAEETRMLGLLRAQGIRPTGAPVLAQYNSPFVPPFLRRNEILVDVSGPEAMH